MTIKSTSKPTSFVTRLSLITWTVIVVFCFSGAAPAAAEQGHNPWWLLAGIAVSKPQAKLLDTLLKHGWAANTEPLWQAYLQEFRAVLTPEQQRVFDINVQAESTWSLYKRGANELWNWRQTGPRATLLRGVFAAGDSYYGLLKDSLRNVAQTQTPAQIQQRWDVGLRAVRTLLTPTEQQQLNKQFIKYASEDSLIAVVRTHDAMRILPGVALSDVQRTQLTPLFAQLAGASDSVWNAVLHQLRVVLTPTQQSVFNVNVTVDSAWRTYEMIFQQLWRNEAASTEDSIKKIFTGQWDHYRAVCDSLQNKSQTSEQMGQRWETDRIAMWSAVMSIRTPNERQEFRRQVYGQFEQFSKEGLLLAAVRAHDPKRLFPGVTPSTDQQKQLSPFLAQAAGASDSVWNAVLPQMRALLTRTQQKVFDVNSTIDSAWVKYGTRYLYLWRVEHPPTDDLMLKLFTSQWNHYRAVSDSLQHVAQTPAQMQQRWDNDRQALGENLTHDERKALEEFRSEF